MRERTRQSLMRAAFRLLGHAEGLSVRVEEICAGAGVSKGTFYNYFKSLEELFHALAIDLSHDFNSAVVATLRDIESRAVGANAAIQHYLLRAKQDPAWGWAMVHLSATGPIFGAESYEACLRTIKGGIDSGEFDVPNAHVGRDLLMGAVLASMLSSLRGIGSSMNPAVVSRHTLRALGVSDKQAARIASMPLPTLSFGAE
jgi:AcrR family transcriptional regulator